MSENKIPSGIDRIVGQRLRWRRRELKLTQEQLGEKLGLTFQQVQKYEKGTNRISASRMQEMSQVLDAPISYFFDESPGGAPAADGGLREADAQFTTDFLSTTEGLQLNRAFARVEDPKVRRKIVDLVKALADQQDN